jgi:hypothetical protein
VTIHKVNLMIKLKSTTKRLILAAMLLPIVLLRAQAFGQSAGMSGTITDTTGAVLPGATVTATNVDTSVKTSTMANNAGIFNFPSLPAGTYTVSAEMPGFRTSKKTDVKLGVGAPIRLNFEMQVAGIATQVEVSTSAADLLLESTATTGTVMSDKVAKELPLIGNDVLGLVNVMGGVVKAENTIFGNSDQTFAGVLADNINITRDGISVNDARYSSGLVTPSRMNPEMVGEFKVILTPVDAEMGRGAGQIQVLTKSGGNEYHGSGVWSNINTGLDAMEWDSKRQNELTKQANTLPENQANPLPEIQPMYKNVNQYTISGGGPIIKNKTFFFASWDQNIVRKRETVHSNMLTNCARKGIYRYWPGWQPDNADNTPSYPANAWSIGTFPSVNYDGTPRQPSANPNKSTPYTIVPGGTPEGMHYGSVFGPLTQTALDQIYADPVNCSQYAFDYTDKNSNPMLSAASWNALRGTYDKSGYIANFSTIMPKPNYFNDGDGLNQAALSWTRTTHGEDTVYGSGMDSRRKSITLKIDHNLSQQHRLSGTYSYEKDGSDGENEPTWPVNTPGFGGYLARAPQTFTVSLTSALKPTLLNEFRFGLAYNMNRTMSPLNNPETGVAAREYLTQITADWATDAPWKGLPVLVNPGTGITDFSMYESNPYGGRYSPPATWGSNDYRWTFADTMTWTKGSHSFKFGGDIRLTKSQSQQDGNPLAFDDNWFPYVIGGSAQNSPPSGLSTAAARAAFPGLVGFDQSPYGSASGNYLQIYNIMDYMAGSVSEIRQFYFVNDKSATKWSDPTTKAGQTRYIRMKQNEFSLFFKDDWKVTSDLTLNLGIRYEYYGVPWVLDGMTQGIVGGAENIFGGTIGGFEQWLQPLPGGGVPAFDSNNLTQWEFIGPDSTHPDRSLLNKDRNNFGPAVGFAYQLPWFGKGKTTLRGGYQLSYMPIGRMDPGRGIMGAAGSQPGVLYANSYQGSTANPYLNLAGIQDLLPTSRLFNSKTPQPMQIRPITDGTQDGSVYDPNIRNPYIQSLTLALTRQIGSSLTIDVRYIGTLSRKQIDVNNLNRNNWISNGLKDAFNAARAGQSSALLDDLYNVTDGSGSTALRSDFFLSGTLASGDFNEVASVLATSNTGYAVPSGVQGALIQNSGLGANFIRTNPQFSAANWSTNRNHTNYHSMQAQAILRPMHGLSFTTTYTWSRDLGVKGDGTDPLDYGADYGVLNGNRKHALTSYGTYNLPLGARDSSGWVKRLAEGWQLSWVYSANSGLPYSVTQTTSMWGGSGVDLVRPDLFNRKDAHVRWGYEVPGTKTTLNPVGRIAGTYNGRNYMPVTDPQCASVTTLQGLQGLCQQNMKALAVIDHYDTDVNGNQIPIAGPVVFQHAAPGTRGNFDTNSLVGPGRWSLDVAVSKNITITEGKTVNFRVDIANILNHATPSGTAPTTYDQRTYAPGNPNGYLSPIYTPLGYIGSTDPFGYIGYKVSHRVFSCKLQFRF